MTVPKLILSKNEQDISPQFDSIPMTLFKHLLLLLFSVVIENNISISSNILSGIKMRDQ